AAAGRRPHRPHRPSMVVGGDLRRPAARPHLPHRERAARAGGPPGDRDPALGRRDPQLLGAEPRRQEGPDSRPYRADRVPRRPPGRLPRPVRGILRPAARLHGARRDRDAARRIRGLGGGATPARRRSRGSTGAPRPRPLPVGHLHDVPRDPGNDGERTQRTGSHACREPRPDRGRTPRQYAREPRRVDPRSAGDQAGRQHAGEPARAGRPARGGRLPGDAAMSAPRETLRDGDGPGSRAAETLAMTWRTPKGIVGWLSNIDHKSTGKRFIVTAFAFFLAAAFLAALMRTQLVVPDNHFVGPDLYNQLFTMHGTTMM